MQLTVQIE